MSQGCLDLISLLALVGPNFWGGGGHEQSTYLRCLWLKLYHRDRNFIKSVHESLAVLENTIIFFISWLAKLLRTLFIKLQLRFLKDRPQFRCVRTQVEVERAHYFWARASECRARTRSSLIKLAMEPTLSLGPFRPNDFSTIRVKFLIKYVRISPLSLAPA